MRTKVLVLHDRWGGAGDEEWLLAYFAEQFFHLGHEVHVAYGTRAGDTFADTLVHEHALPFLAASDHRPSGEDLAALTALVRSTRPALVYLLRVRHAAVFNTLQAEFPTLPRVWHVLDHEPWCPAGSKLHTWPEGACMQTLGQDCLRSIALGRCSMRTALPPAPETAVTERRRLLEAARRCDHILVPTRAMAGQVAAEMGPAHPPVTVVPWPVGFVAEHRRRPRRDLVVYTGPLDKHSGVDVLLEAVGRLHPETKVTLRLHVTHQDPQFRRTCEVAAERLAAERPGAGVEFLLAADEAALRAAYAEAAAMVMPTLWPVPAAPGILAAMAQAVPVLVSDTGALGDAVQEDVTGLLARPGDTAHWAAQLQRLLDAPAWARRLGRHGRSHTETALSPRRYVRVMTRVIDDLVFAQPARGASSAESLQEAVG